MDKESILLHIIKQEHQEVLPQYVKMEHIVLAETVVELVLIMEVLRPGCDEFGSSSAIINKYTKIWNKNIILAA